MPSTQTRIPTTRAIIALLILATIFWIAIFGFKLINFWLGMAIATTILASISGALFGFDLKKSDCKISSIILGIGSAILLYGIFYCGDFIANYIFPFAKAQVDNIYTIKNEGNPWSIAFILFFITSPAEELFWRGTIQRFTMHRFGNVGGWLLGAFIYSAVHIFSGNIMLVLAALIAGLFWGYLYMRTRNLIACIISHAIWTVGIFLLFPI